MSSPIRLETDRIRGFHNPVAFVDCMSLTRDFPTFFLPLTGIDPNRVAGDFEIAGGFSGRDRFVGDADNAVLKYLINSPQLLDTDWPLVLFGPNGSGKTAIALSVARQIVADQVADGSRPRKFVVLPARDFARRFAHAVETDSIDQFRQWMLDSAGILVDEVGQLKSFPAAQNELTSLLDQLAIHSGPVIATAGARWIEFGHLTPKLVSRLSSGLCLGLNPPGFEARRVIIGDTADRFDLLLGNDVRDFLASRLNVSWPLIQSFFAQFNAWILASDQGTRMVDIDLVSRFLKHFTHQSRKRSVDSIVKLVGKSLRIKVADIKSNSRKQSTVLARSVVVYFLRRHLKMSFASIGSVLGGRDHSTIMHSLRQVEIMVAKDEKKASLIRNLEKSIVESELMCDHIIGE